MPGSNFHTLEGGEIDQSADRLREDCRHPWTLRFNR